MIEDKDYKDVVVDNDAIVNTPAEELPDEPYNIPQGEKPHLNPNPGYGDDGETKPAIKTDLVEGERGTPEIKNVEQEGIRVERDPTNFVGGLFIKGKTIEDYIDQEGGVTQEELESALATKQDKLDSAVAGTLAKVIGLDSSGKVVQDEITSGTIVSLLGLDSDGKLVKQTKSDVVKPIYIHPITINGSGSYAYDRFICLIFNNDPTPFTKETFIAYVKALSQIVAGNVARILCSGSYVYSDNVIYPTAYIFSNNGGTLNVAFPNNSSGIENIINDEGTSFFDGVNIIN